jgi:bifunctional non-homologous end joining protein LigD
MPPVIPMRLLRIPEPLDSPDFIFEPKLDGFRALVHVRGHRCELVSCNGHTFKQWPQPAEEIAHAVRALSCVLDGEICCLEPDGRTHFNKLLFRREWPFFYAFDVLSIDCEDLTGLPLLKRKRRLLRIMPTIETRLLYPRSQ